MSEEKRLVHAEVDEGTIMYEVVPDGDTNAILRFSKDEKGMFDLRLTPAVVRELIRELQPYTHARKKKKV